MEWACHPSTEDVETGGQGFKALHNEFEGSLGYMRSHLKTNDKIFVVKDRPSLTKANFVLLILSYFYSFFYVKIHMASTRLSLNKDIYVRKINGFVTFR